MRKLLPFIALAVMLWAVDAVEAGARFARPGVFVQPFRPRVFAPVFVPRVFAPRLFVPGFVPRSQFVDPFLFERQRFAAPIFFPRRQFVLPY